MFKSIVLIALIYPFLVLLGKRFGLQLPFSGWVLVAWLLAFTFMACDLTLRFCRKVGIVPKPIERKRENAGRNHRFVILNEVGEYLARDPDNPMDRYAESYWVNHDPAHSFTNQRDKAYISYFASTAERIRGEVINPAPEPPAPPSLEDLIYNQRTGQYDLKVKTAPLSIAPVKQAYRVVRVRATKEEIQKTAERDRESHETWRRERQERWEAENPQQALVEKLVAAQQATRQMSEGKFGSAWVTRTHGAAAGAFIEGLTKK